MQAHVNTSHIHNQLLPSCYKMSKSKLTLKDVSFYLKGDSSGGFAAAVAYLVKKNHIYGAFYGYAGGGDYDGGYFSISQDDWEIQILGFDQAEEDQNSDTYNALMALCGKMSDDEDGSMLSAEGLSLLKKGEDDGNDGIVVLLNEFDGDSLSEVSEQWNISIRFES